MNKTKIQMHRNNKQNRTVIRNGWWNGTSMNNGRPMVEFVVDVVMQAKNGER